MPIFDTAERALLGGATDVISAFDYLNDSARPEAGKVRDLLERYYSRYPKAHQEGLRSRIRSVRDEQHNSAVFELILHELLISAGCIIEEIEPQVPGSNNQPDFLVKSASGAPFYLEAVAPTCMPLEGVGAAKRMGEVMNAIDQVTSPDFYLSVYTNGAPAGAVATTKLRTSIEQWLSSLKYTDVKKAWDEKLDIPKFEVSIQGLSIRIEPVPRLQSRGRLGERSIAARMRGVELVADHESIRRAVVKKSNRYGSLRLPYIVAVNAMGNGSGEDQANDALFGSEMYQSYRDANGKLCERVVRDTNGVWLGPTGPRKRGVSAVISTERLTAWSLSQRRARVFLNPWATHPITSPLPLEIRRIQQDRLVADQGQSIQELLNIPQDWPE